jgi:hypothetical protein
MADLDRKGVSGRDYDHRAWTGLDHERAVRESGRAYRPGKVCDRPQLSEREAGKPSDHRGLK